MAHSGGMGLVPGNFMCSFYERCGLEEGFSRNPSVIPCQRIFSYIVFPGAWTRFEQPEHVLQPTSLITTL